MASTGAKRPSSGSADTEPDVKKPKDAITSNGNSSNGMRRFKAYFSERKGERDDMQDAHVIIDDLLPSCTWSPPKSEELHRLSYFAVFDGHNGPRASEYAAKHLHKSIAHRMVLGPDLKTIETAMKRTLTESYKALDDAFLAAASQAKPAWKDGSTATTILLLNNTLFIANLGDSRAVLCRHKSEENKDISLVLTKDHSPQMFDERMRIQKAGGHVVDGRILGMLEVSRSLGDGQYKNHGVSCVPDIKKCTLTPNDRYLLIACDGLWKTFSNQDVVSYFDTQLKAIRARNDIVATDDRTVVEQQYDQVCSELAGEAVRRGSGDNVTVLCIVFD